MIPIVFYSSLTEGKPKGTITRGCANGDWKDMCRPRKYTETKGAELIQSKRCRIIANAVTNYFGASES